MAKAANIADFLLHAKISPPNSSRDYLRQLEPEPVSGCLG